MASLKELSAEYRFEAVKIKMLIRQRKVEGAPEWELRELRKMLGDVREIARTLDGYYDLPRTDPKITMIGLRAGVANDR